VPGSRVKVPRTTYYIMGEVPERSYGRLTEIVKKKRKGPGSKEVLRGPRRAASPGLVVIVGGLKKARVFFRKNVQKKEKVKGGDNRSAQENHLIIPSHSDSRVGNSKPVTQFWGADWRGGKLPAA